MTGDEGEPLPRFASVEDFLRWHEGQDHRYEMIGGTARPVPRRSLTHARLSRRALIVLSRHLEGTTCEAFGSDLAVALSNGDVVYPSVSVSCGLDDEDALRHPVAVIDVHPSTAPLQGRVGRYLALPSLRHLVILREDQVVEQYHRTCPDEGFAITVHQKMDVLDLHALRTRVAVHAFYE